MPGWHAALATNGSAPAASTSRQSKAVHPSSIRVSRIDIDDLRIDGDDECAAYEDPHADPTRDERRACLASAPRASSSPRQRKR